MLELEIKIGGMEHGPHGPKEDFGPGAFKGPHGFEQQCGNGFDEDPQQLYEQLLEAISLIDTQTDSALSGANSPLDSIKAIDEITSRILWGKQTPENPDSSYQNANYGEHVAAGLMMDNKADANLPQEKDEDEDDDDRHGKRF